MSFDVTLNAWLTLSLAKGVSGEDARRPLKEFGSPDSIFAASSVSLKAIVKPSDANEINNGHMGETLTPVLSWLEEDNNHMVTLADKEYPQRLLNIPGPPILLYVKGRLDLLNRGALHGRCDVFVIPGSIHAPQSKGCHALLKKGAKLIENAQDTLDKICEKLPIASHNPINQRTVIPEAGHELLEHIGFDSVDVDALSARCGLTIAELSAMLLTFELEGRISILPGGLYQRIQ